MDEAQVPEPPELHQAVSFGLPLDAFDNLIRAAADIDALWWGRTALFEAVMTRDHPAALRLVAAGADPWRPQMNGWSPGRLNLAGPEPGLFGPVPAGVGLTEQEREAVRRSGRLIGTLADLEFDGMSIACVAEIDAAEAIRRLGGRPFEDDDFDRTVGVTDVAGGCVVAQRAGYTAAAPGVLALLTAGTRGYGMYANPKSGNQGDSFRDGVMLGSDLHPGGGQAAPDDPADEVLRIYLYAHQALAYCCDAAGVEPSDARAFTGPPDAMVRIADIELWPL
ncbi:hypothetical protein [Paractinoplanes lichenicola]|uniref:Uncharacterized protein n=1 Tax=Paractinoplanes lichenicola TaxID=2802976 RepID=A0ABS1VF19_9ACTN|nr:hypothetical protein [Actinoplanes lichenicola]MBL7252749.1 hypothetical protein [Actinoplanes lichenicola]